jgi:hypothetical protein
MFLTTIATGYVFREQKWLRGAVVCCCHSAAPPLDRVRAHQSGRISVILDLFTFAQLLGGVRDEQAKRVAITAPRIGARLRH